MESHNNVQFTFEELLAQNKALSEQLSQSQVDKDFVWNLWKTLQNENPDVTDAISKVVAREQEKSDAKDLKILNILKQKDDQIQMLQEISADNQTQLKHANERLSELLVGKSISDDKLSQYETDIKELEAKIEHLQDVIKMKESQETLAEKDFNEQHLELQKTSSELRNVCDEHLQKVNELETRLTSRDEELQNLNSRLAEKDGEFNRILIELDHECKQKQMLFSEKEDAETLVKELNDQVALVKSEQLKTQEKLDKTEEKYQKNDVLIRELNIQIQNIESEKQNMIKQLDEHTSCAKHISNQCQLIKDLENLQEETHEVLGKQQTNHQQEINTLQKALSESTKKFSKLQKKLDKVLSEKIDLSNVIEVLRKDRELTKTCSKCDELQDELQTCQKNYDVLLTNFNKKCQQLSTAQECFSKNIENLNNSLSEIENSSDVLRVKIQSETIEKLQQLLKSMDEELNTVRSAHKKRQERYNLLKENYNLVLKQLATYEDSLTANQKSNKIPRATPEALQREDSKSVWNELDYYRRKYETLNKERPDMEEEIDRLKVKSAGDQTHLNEMKLHLLELKNAMRAKEEEEVEAESKGDLVPYVQSLEVNSSQKLVNSWKDKAYRFEQENIDLQEKCDLLSEKNRSLVSEVNRLKKDLASSKPIVKTKDAHAQTTFQEANQTELLKKMNEVIDAVHNDRLTVSQFESTLKATANKKYVASSMQTTPRKTTPPKVQFNQIEHSTQTDITSDSSSDNVVESNKLRRKKNKLQNESQRLLLLKSDLHQENRSLKKRIFSLESQVNHLRESKVSLRKTVSDIQDENDRLKVELVENLHKLQTTREVLQNRTKELEIYAKDLHVFEEAHEKKLMEESKKTSQEYKTIENKLKHTTMECSKLSFQNKTLTGENEMLSLKLKDYQERISSVEKRLTEKRNYVKELKDKNDDLQRTLDKNMDDQDGASKKLKSVLERETKNKNYIQNLKSKIEELISEKSVIQESLDIVTSELKKKSDLLHDSQLLCRQAETAISQMETTAYEQLQSQQKSHEDRYVIIKMRYEKCVNQLNEIKIAVKNFTELILSEIHDKRARVAEEHAHKIKKLRRARQEELYRSKARDIACSILNMSTNDLQEFLEDDVDDTDGKTSIPLYEDNDIREKLDVILKKQTNFGKILSRFLMDLVKYNEKLLSQDAEGSL